MSDAHGEHPGGGVLLPRDVSDAFRELMESDESIWWYSRTVLVHPQRDDEEQPT